MRRSRRAASGVHPPGKLDRMFAPGLCRLDVPATIDLSVCAIAASSSGCGPPSPVATPKLARLPSSHMERQYLSSRANRVMHARAQARAHVRTRTGTRARTHASPQGRSFAASALPHSRGLFMDRILRERRPAAPRIYCEICGGQSRRICASVGPSADVGGAGHDRATAVLLLACGHAPAHDEHACKRMHLRTFWPAALQPCSLGRRYRGIRGRAGPWVSAELIVACDAHGSSAPTHSVVDSRHPADCRSLVAHGQRRVLAECDPAQQSPLT